MTKLAVPTRIIKYKGPMDMFGLYNMIAGWMASKGCVVYNEKTKHKVTGGGLEYEYGLMGTKKEDEYYKAIFKADFIIKNAKEIEVVRNGVKKKYLDGTFTIHLDGHIITDMQEVYDENKFTVELRKFMEKYVIKDVNTSLYADRLDYKVVELQTEIKEFIKLHSQGNAYAGAW